MPRRRAAALPRISKGLSFPESTNFSKKNRVKFCILKNLPYLCSVNRNSNGYG
jgi:hypothetical protein